MCNLVSQLYYNAVDKKVKLPCKQICTIVQVYQKSLNTYVDTKRQSLSKYKKIQDIVTFQKKIAHLQFFLHKIIQSFLFFITPVVPSGKLHSPRYFSVNIDIFFLKILCTYFHTCFLAHKVNSTFFNQWKLNSETCTNVLL